MDMIGHPLKRHAQGGDVIGPAPLNLMVRDCDGYAELVAAGELDMTSASKLRACMNDLLADRRVHVLCDLSGLTFCDSIGLTEMLTCSRRYAAAGGWMRLAAPSTSVLQLLQITGLLSVLE